MSAEAQASARPLRAYIAFDKSGPEEGAVLVFAHDRREAMRLGRPATMDWGSEFLDVRVRRLRGDCAHLRLKDGPHVNDNPPVCRVCELWDYEPLDATGCCSTCAEDEEDGFRVRAIEAAVKEYAIDAQKDVDEHVRRALACHAITTRPVREA